MKRSSRPRAQDMTSPEKASNEASGMRSPVEHAPNNESRRRAAATVGKVAGVALLTGTSGQWAKPVINSVLLPAHAATSGIPGTGSIDPETPASCSRVERHRDRVVIQDANWSDSLFIPQFDDSTGSLKSVTVEWTAELTGGIRLENTEDRQGSSAGDLVEIGARVAAEMSLDGPAGMTFGMVTPEVTRSDNVTGYDGTLDYTGDSGRNYDGVTFEKTTSLEFTDARTLALFTGQGAVEFFGQSVGVSRSFGSANLVAQIETRSGMRLLVTYSCGE